MGTLLDLDLHLFARGVTADEFELVLRALAALVPLIACVLGVLIGDVVLVRAGVADVAIALAMLPVELALVDGLAVHIERTFGAHERARRVLGVMVNSALGSTDRGDRDRRGEPELLPFLFLDLEGETAALDVNTPINDLAALFLTLDLDDRLGSDHELAL